MKMIAAFVLLLLSFSFANCEQKTKASVTGQWTMHYMTHINGVTVRDEDINIKLKKKEIIATCRFTEDSKYQYVRNTKAKDEPVTNGSYHLGRDTIFIQDDFGYHHRKILKLTTDSLILLRDDHITAWYR